MVSDIKTNRSQETASVRHQSPAAAAAAAASVGSVYPHHSAGTHASHLVPPAPPASVLDLRSRLLVDACSAFSSVRRPTSRDRHRQPDVGACDHARPTTTTTTKPRIWCIADVATSPDHGPSRPATGTLSSHIPLSSTSVGVYPV